MKEIESWQNGKFIPNSQIGTKVWDAHYMFGDAAFDAFRTYKHTPHLLNQHINRLYKSAKCALYDMKSIESYMSKEKLISTIHEVMDHNKEFFKDDEYRFMIYISPGYFRIYDDLGNVGPIITINLTTTSRYAKGIVPYLNKGVTALISSQTQIPSRFLNPKIKSCSRLINGMAEREAAEYGKGVYPILLDEHGYVCESSGASVGFIRDSTLYLAKANTLEGCTMKFIETIAEYRGISVVKGDYDVYDIMNSDGIIFTGAFVGILPCYNIIYCNKKHKLQGGEKTINKLIDGYSRRLGIDVNDQWRSWYAQID